MTTAIMARHRAHQRRRRRLSWPRGLLLLALVAVPGTLLTGLTVRDVPAWIGAADALTASTASPTSERDRDWRGRRGVYLTSGLAANRERLQRYVDQLKAHGLDTLVIDVKDNSSVVPYPSEVELAAEIGARRARFDLDELADWLQERDIYVIARHVVFHDPKLAAHLDSPIAPWVRPTNAAVVDYNVALAREVAASGVDEIQFDYIRYPDGGAYEPVYADRYRAITSFLRQVDGAVGEQIHLSADVYGRTLRSWNRNRVDPIGQNLEAMMPYVDALSPMVYPSHYESRRYRHDPYGTVRDELALGLERGLSMRPYLQAFERHRPPEMTQVAYIAEQIRAVRELGLDGYLFWNPQGDYANLWQAIESIRASAAEPAD